MPVQYMFPVNNTSDSLNTWLNSGGGSGLAYLNINEGIASATDSDYVIYQSGASTSPVITLGRLIVAPSSVSFTYRASGIATINSISLRDTNSLIIANNTSPQSISGSFTNRTVTLSGVNTATRNFANANIQFSFSGTPSGVAISALDMSASGSLSVLTNALSTYINGEPSASLIRYPAQSGDGAWSSGFSSGFGGLPEELLALNITGLVTTTNTLSMFCKQDKSIKIRPSGDSGGSGIWTNSSGTTTNLWDYVNDRVGSTLSDIDYIYNLQSGILNRPDNLYWISDSGIFKSKLDGSSITQVSQTNETLRNSTHACYDIVNDFIYYGNEIGGTSRIGMIQKDGYYEASLIQEDVGGALAYDPKDDYIYSLSKAGEFYMCDRNEDVSYLQTLAGNFRETPHRRLRIDHKNRNIYAIAQDQTSTLSRLFKYNIPTSGWTQLRTLSYGLFGGAFDLDVANSSIYYAASPNDLTSTTFYGIVKEDMYSGVGTRIIEPSGSAFFQCQELLLDVTNSGLYYVAQDNSGATLNYRTVKTSLSGTSPTTIHTIPEASGANALMLDGPVYKSYVDFQLTDFEVDFGNPNNPNKLIESVYVLSEVEDFGEYSYINAKVLTGDKQNVIWMPYLRGSGNVIGGSGIQSLQLGKSYSYINPSYNTSSEWNNSILRMELSSINSSNSGNFRIYNTEVDISAGASYAINSGLAMYTLGGGHNNDSVTLMTLAGTSIGGTSLYTIASSNMSGDSTLYTTGLSRDGSGVPMYITAMTKSQANMSLFIPAVTPVPSSIDMPMYTVGGSPNAVNYAPLFIGVDGSENRPYGKMNLFMTGTGGYPTTARMNMFLKSDAIKTGGTLPMYIQNDSSGINKFTTMYIKTNDYLEQSGNMNLFIARDTESLMNNTTMYLKVNDGVNSGVPLYLYAMTNARSGIDLVMPNTIGHSGQNTTLYVNGF